MPTIRTVVLIVSILFIPSLSHTDDLSQQIAQHRMGTLTVIAAPGASVQIEQVRHDFWFGAALSNWMFQPGNTSPDAQKYKEVFLEKL